MRRFAGLTFALVLTGVLLSGEVSSDSPTKDTQFTYARIRYHMTRDAVFVREVPWHHDYPFGDEIFPTFVKEVTGVDTKSDSYQIVDIDSPELFDYPFAYLCEPGYLNLNEKDVENFREYLDRGGFVLVDDFRGPRHLDNLIQQMKKVYPARDIVRLDISHPVFNSFYKIDSLDMAPPYGNMPVEFFGLKDDHDRLQMIINYNNDLSEVWEWLDKGELPLSDAALSLKLGVNYLVYAFTH
jgi:Domain of unknown function (DUF4159)